MNSGNVGLKQSQLSRAIVCLQRDCECLQDAVELLCGDRKELLPQEVGQLYASLRSGGVNMKQVNAAMDKVCVFENGERNAGINELSFLLKELDRRYFILQGAQWDFAMLDRTREGGISEKDALFLFRAVHGNIFTAESWRAFQQSRNASQSGTKVTWDEMELPLCDIPTLSGRLL